MKMKQLTIISLLMVFAFTGFTQTVKPTQQNPNRPANSAVPASKSTKDSVVYMVPINTVYDTIKVYAVEAQLSQPLYVAPFQIVLKSFVYSDNTVKPVEQLCYKVVDGVWTLIPNFQKRMIWMVREEDFEN